MSKIRLLIVDDSLLFRSQIKLALKDCADIEIVDSASNGKLAIERMQTLNPDIVILDIEMPIMDGVETYKEMKKLGITCQVILFSSLGKSSVEKSLEAIRLGAHDVVTKPQAEGGILMSPTDKIKDALVPKIQSLASRLKPSAPSQVQSATHTKFIWETFTPDVLVIASSTGGPGALDEFFENFKQEVSYPILITQHMPPVFTASLAQRLGMVSGRIAHEAVHGEAVLPNHIYVAPGNYHMSIAGSRLNPTIDLDQKEMRNHIRPCADFLFESAAKIFARKTLGVVLTGMGRDGADGAMAIKKNHGPVCIQNKESCVVFGMPGAVEAEGNYDFAGTPGEIARKITALSSSLRKTYVA